MRRMKSRRRDHTHKRKLSHKHKQSHKRSHKHKHSHKHSHKRSHKHKQRNESVEWSGGGWSTGPDYVSPGNLVYQQYDGAGKDCSQIPVRPGYISPSSSPSPSTQGLPGFRGGYRHNRHNKYKGGRWGVEFPMAPLTPNGVGVTGNYSRIPCEMSASNPLNGAPVSGGGYKKRSHRHRHRGGFLSGSPYDGSSHASFPSVHVGAADSMRYNAPTAGYKNDFQSFAGQSPVGGLTIQTPYDARVSNPACR